MKLLHGCRLVLGVVFILVAPALAAGTDSRPFVMRLQDDVERLDWNYVNHWINACVLKNIMAGIYQLDANGKLQLDLALSVAASPDGRIYTFRLRPNVLWSDGKPLVASQFIDSWKRMLAPSSPSRGKLFFLDVEGAEAFSKGAVRDFSTVGMKALDDHTLEVRLKRRAAHVLDGLAFWASFPIRRDLLDRYGAAWSNPENLVVLGPYTIASYERGKRILFKRNQKYFGPAAKIDTLNYTILDNDEIALNMFAQKKIDNVWTGLSREASKQVGKASFHSYPFPAAMTLLLNMSTYPFNIVSARRAVAMAIDRTRISRGLSTNYEIADSLISHRIFPAGAGAVLPFDPIEAKRLWGTAVSKGTLGKPLELLVRSLDRNAPVAELIRDQLKRNLDLDVKITYLPTRDFGQLADLSVGAMSLLDSTDFTEPHTFLLGFAKQVKNPNFGALLEQAGGAETGDQRTRLYRKALDILLREDVLVVPLYHFNYTVLVQPEVRNYKITPIGDVFLRDVYFAKP